MQNWARTWETQPPLASWLLSPLSALYAGGWLAYEATYRFGAKKPYIASVPVVCVGNLTVGGSGKTPMVIHLARVLHEMGREVVISCSGYGSAASEAAQLAPEGPLSAAEWGDEAALLREELPAGVSLIVGRRRVLAAQICEREFPGSVLLMDDGFQHLPLHKNVTLLLDPNRWNSFCLPAGPYREPRSLGRRRATLVLPGPFQLSLEKTFRTASELPEEADLLSAIGQPFRLLRSLGDEGIELREVRLLPDHDPLTAGNLLRGLGESRPLIVTSKDWVKLRERKDLGEREIIVAGYSLTIEPKEEFRQWLEARLDEAKPARTGK
jgi:tetraacyldisaccharide 4'-kinase